MHNSIKKESWLFEITPKSSLFNLKLKEIWQYRDLLFLFVKRDLVTLYKQTVLGPLWYLIQPLMTSVIFTVIFNGIAAIDVGDNIHPFVFNLAGITIWNYFSDCFKGTSDTFKKNEHIFNKVYFPRVIMPMSTIVSNLLKFGIQLLIFISFYIFFSFQGNAGEIDVVTIMYFPVLVLIMGLLGLGLGMIISSMTTKYRDLTFLVGFGIQLLMYLSAVMYPTEVAVTKLQNNFPKTSEFITPFIEGNPLAKIVESFRYMFFSQGNFSFQDILWSISIAVLVFFIGLTIFNKTEKSFVDTI